MLDRRTGFAYEGRVSGLPRRTWLIVGLAVVALAAAFLLPAMPQPPAYHDFADSRPMFGVANFLDVTSNAAFLLVGVAGIFVAYRPRTRLSTGAERLLYAVFFAGMVLTAGGSGYYHLSPDNETLFWDRLPMTISFMALVAAQVAERISLRAGVILLAPMLLVGVGSVVYWRETERAGAGNVTPYGILQGFSVVVMLLLAMLPSRYTRGNDVYAIFAAYVAAKILEALDWQILEATGVSGHTLKHLAAALAGYFVLRMIALRSPVESPPTARR
ncbi:MAG: hypothetical protein RJA59_1184 [Pseudomonadota bacterium]